MYKVVSYYREDPKAMNDFLADSRYVWDEHVFYTRNAIISILENLADAEYVTNRLIENQNNIGNLMRPYYSADVVDEYVSLLKDHIALVAEFAKAVRDKKDIMPIQSQMQSNSAAIVSFLNTADPNRWSTTVVNNLWSKHMDYTAQQVMSRVNKEWLTDIAAADENHKVITEFADLFGNGIVFQNLEKFSK